MRSDSLMGRYGSGGAILAYAVGGLTEAQERARPGPGEWSISEVVGHLVDTDLVFSERMKRVIAEEEPVIQRFDENLWVERLSGQEASVEEGVDLLAANRRWMMRILRRCTDADFARSGRHTETGRVTLADLLAKVTNHLDHHLRFVYMKRSTLGVALPPRFGSEQIRF